MSFDAKFVGGAEQAQRNARKKAGTRILRPGESSQTDRHFLPRKMPPMERFFASLLKSPASDFAQAYKSRDAQDRLVSLICRRLGLSMPRGGLEALYRNKNAHFESRAALVMEESRHALSEALARRWARRDGSSTRDAMQLRLESMQAKKKSGHLILVFRRDKAFSLSEQYQIRAGTCYEIIPPGPRSVDRVILGNVVSSRKDSWSDGRRYDDEESAATLTLMIYDPLEASGDDGDWQVTPVTALISMMRQFEACLHYAGNVPFLLHLMGGKGATHIRFDQEDCPAVLDEEKKEEDESPSIDTAALFCLPTLNPTQERACRTYLNSPPNTVSLVQGPPGTGKTTNLITIICRYLAESLASGGKRRLLVCAPTNKAVSVISSRFLASIRREAPYTFNAVMIGDQDKLLDDGQNDTHVARTSCEIFAYTWGQTLVQESKEIRRRLDEGNYVSAQLLIRVSWLSAKLVKSLLRPPTNYRIVELTARLSEAVDSLSSSESTSAEARQGLREALVSIEKQISSLIPLDVTREVLRSADIIFCTLASAGNSLMKTTAPVQDLIVDEAAASTEPEMYIPFHLMPNRLLAVGDPMQLPATVFSRLADRMGLSKSLHERLMYDLEKDHIMLDIQYRMKPDISSFPCRQFYNGKLANGENVNCPLFRNDVALLSGSPYTYLHIDGAEKKGSTGSYYNTAEAHQVIDLVGSLRSTSANRSDWFSIDRIRVITFYQAQVSLIQGLLKQAGLGRAAVATVDSSQGCEADIVIVSFVRSVHRGDGTGRQAAGFLTDDRRLNVALTRAKYQLICVGNAEGLRQLTSAPTLQALAIDAFERNCVVDNSKENIQGRRPAAVSNDQRTAKKRRKKQRGSSSR